MKRLSRILVLLLLPSFSFAQHFEAGILLGASNYVGDLSNNSSNLYLKETKPALGILGRYNFNDLFALRLGLNYTWVAGQDANVRNDDFVRSRNLSFRSSILEGALIGEINIPGYQPYGLYRPFSPYLFVGIAVAKFNPKARYEGNWVALQPLQTEGEAYSRVTAAIPFGFGVKYALTDKINIGLELGARATFTDYLDDVSGQYVAHSGELLSATLADRSGEINNGVSRFAPGDQRGDASGNDWYFILGATVSYNFLDNGLMGGRKRGRSKAGCRTGL
jgi:opacity protein-like surface antigen